MKNKARYSMNSNRALRQAKRDKIAMQEKRLRYIRARAAEVHCGMGYLAPEEPFPGLLGMDRMGTLPNELHEIPAGFMGIDEASDDKPSDQPPYGGLAVFEDLNAEDVAQALESIKPRATKEHGRTYLSGISDRSRSGVEIVSRLLRKFTKTARRTQ